MHARHWQQINACFQAFHYCSRYTGMKHHCDRALVISQTVRTVKGTDFFLLYCLFYLCLCWKRYVLPWLFLMHSSGGHVMLNFSLMNIFNWKHSWMCWIYNILCFKLLPFCLIGTLKRSKLGFVRIFLYSLCVLVRTVLAKHDPTWFHSVHFLGQRRGRINERTSLCRVKSNTEPARCACLKETKQ